MEHETYRPMGHTRLLGMCIGYAYVNNILAPDFLLFSCDQLIEWYLSHKNAPVVLLEAA